MQQNTPNETQPIVAKAPRENKNFLNTQIQTLREKGFSSGEQAIIVSFKTQTAYLVDYNGNITKAYPVSTAKNGIRNADNSEQTPSGTLEINHKIGGKSETMTVFKGKRAKVLQTSKPSIETKILSRLGF